MMPLLLASCCAALLLLGLSAQAQGLPVRIHKEIRTFSGSPERVVAAEGAARYTLVSAHKEGGRPWADAVWAKRTPEGVTYLSRAYDCASGVYRWLGESARIDRISLSVRSIDQIAPRRLTPGSIEHRLAAHACGL